MQMIDATFDNGADAEGFAFAMGESGMLQKGDTTLIIRVLQTAAEDAPACGNGYDDVE